MAKKKKKIAPQQKISFRKHTPSKQLSPDRDFPTIDGFGNRKAVCKRCHCTLIDHEPAYQHGEFWHPILDKDGKPRKCINVGQVFSATDAEIEPFLRKSRRRYLKRMGIRP